LETWQRSLGLSGITMVRNNITYWIKILKFIFETLNFILGLFILFLVEGRGAKLLYASLYRMHQAVLYGWTRTVLLWIGDHLRSVALPQLKLH